MFNNRLNKYKKKYITNFIKQKTYLEYVCSINLIYSKLLEIKVSDIFILNNNYNINNFTKKLLDEYEIVYILKSLLENKNECIYFIYILNKNLKLIFKKMENKKNFDVIICVLKAILKLNINARESEMKFFVINLLEIFTHILIKKLKYYDKYNTKSSLQK